MDLTLKELYRARRARRNIIRPRLRTIIRAQLKDRLKQGWFICIGVFSIICTHCG
ncbi:hypothetical protein LINPERHAP2_LOCUS211, partial [Linum perenne]